MSARSRHASTEAQPRAAIYARYSTDLQNERSTEDQIELCRAYAKRTGYEVVAEYADKAQSGGSMFRDGLRDMLEAANAGRFDVILVEALDRLSRDMEDLAGMHKRMRAKGVKLVTVHEGEASTVLVGLRGLVGQMFREDNKHKIRRGMSGRIRDGLSAGGKAYGYAPVPGQPGKLVIVESEAATVRRIFAAYAGNKAPKAICRMLNADGIPAPRGKLWAPTALLGKADRGSGILRNTLYDGRRVWNKSEMYVDPDTGRRLSRPNPESEWQTADVPHLRIVDRDLFDAVQAKLAHCAQIAKTGPLVGNARPRYLLSGLLRCGSCGAGMARAGRDKSGRHRLRCSAHTNSGACPDPRTFYADEVDQLVIDGLADELASPAQIEKYAKAYIKARIASEADQHRQRADIKRRIAAIEKDNDRLLDMLLNNEGVRSAVDARMKSQDAERQQLVAKLATIPEGSNVVLHPTAIKHLAAKLKGPARDWLHSPRARLTVALDQLHDMGELAPIVRELIRTVTVSRDPSDDGLVIEVEAHLDPFLLEEGGQSRGGGHVGSGGGI